MRHLGKFQCGRCKDCFVGDIGVTGVSMDNVAEKWLTELNLSESQIKQLPPEISKLTDLTKLNLSENQIKQLPPEISKLTNLTSLDLSSNQLAQLSPEISKLTSLTSLDLSDNQLIQLPAEIGKLTNLRLFDLSDNQLTQLPAEIGNLTNLTLLDLYNNKLTQLPPEIAKLTKLNKNSGLEYCLGLILKNNKFKVPEEVLNRENPQEAIKEILFANYREGQPKDGELLLSIAIQRNLRKGELTKITKWLNMFKIRAYFAVDKAPDIKLSRKSENAMHEIKQYISNKYQNHISQVYDQKAK